ncbi:MAG: twin transmembrane helix small protein [Pseudomonadota bacterium]
MDQHPMFWVAAAACIVVLIVLMIGVGGFARGGEFNQKYANKIMRLRLLMQFIAVVLIVIAAAFFRTPG